MGSLIIKLIFKLTIGTILYIHAPALALVYVLFLLESVYKAYEANKALQNFKKSYEAAVREYKAGAGAEAYKKPEDGSEGSGPTWQ